MKALLRRLGPVWRVQRRRRPGLTGAVERTALAARLDVVSEVASLRTRVAELERDHRLLAAHVAVLTEQLAAGGAERPSAEQAEATQRARLAAVAFYEERIAALEAAVGGRGSARGVGASGGRTEADA